MNRSTNLSVSNKQDLTFGRRLSLKLDVVRRSCADIMLESDNTGNCIGSSSSSDPNLIGNACMGSNNKESPCCAGAPSHQQKKLASVYHRRSTMSAAANFAEDHVHANNNPAEANHHNSSASDFYPNSSDRRLILENITATRQIMDLKLQVAELASKNDTLSHENRLLHEANSQLELDCAETHSDLDLAYERISQLKKERDEAVRDLTRTRVLQIREDSRRSKMLGGGSGLHNQHKTSSKNKSKAGSSSANKNGGSGRSHASSSASSMGGNKEGSNSSSLSRQSGWFRRFTSSRQDQKQPESTCTLSSPPKTSSAAATAGICSMGNASRTAINAGTGIHASSKGLFSFLAVDDTSDDVTRQMEVLPGRRTSDSPPTPDWGDPTPHQTPQPPVLTRRSMPRAVGEEYTETIKNDNNDDDEEEEDTRIKRKDTEGDVKAFFSSLTRRTTDPLSLYGDDKSDDEDEDDKDTNETFATCRNQSRLPFDDYHRDSSTGKGSQQNATWDDDDDDDDDDDSSIDRDESFVYQAMRKHPNNKNDIQSLLVSNKLSLDSGEAGLDPLPRRRSLNACEA